MSKKKDSGVKKKIGKNENFNESSNQRSGSKQNINKVRNDSPPPKKKR